MKSGVQKGIKWFDDWALSGYKVSTLQLGLFRVFYASYFLFWSKVPDFSDTLNAFPKGIFNPPPGLAAMANGIPNSLFLEVADMVILVLFGLLFLGFFTRWVSILLCVLITIMFGFVYGSGKIDHNFVAWLTLLVMSFSNWGASFSLDALLFGKDRSICSWPVSLLSLILGFAWFTAGSVKLLGGWLDITDQMSQAFFLRNYYALDRTDFLAGFFLEIHSPFLWEILDWITVVFEIGFLFAAFIPRLFRIWTLVACVFHLIVFLQLNIPFSEYQPLYLLFWLPLLQTSQVNDTSQKKKILLIGGVFISICFVVQIFQGIPVFLLVLDLLTLDKYYYPLLLGLPLVILLTGFVVSQKKISWPGRNPRL